MRSRPPDDRSLINESRPIGHHEQFDADPFSVGAPAIHHMTKRLRRSGLVTRPFAGCRTGLQLARHIRGSRCGHRTAHRYPVGTGWHLHRNHGEGHALHLAGRLHHRPGSALQRNTAARPRFGSTGEQGLHGPVDRDLAPVQGGQTGRQGQPAKRSDRHPEPEFSGGDANRRRPGQQGHAGVSQATPIRSDPESSLIHDVFPR